MKGWCLVSLLLLSSPAMTAGVKESPPFSLTESPGRYAVGLQVVYQYDESREFRGATDTLGAPTPTLRDRPLQVLIWYPAKGRSESRMTLDDYLGLLASETRFQSPAISPDSAAWHAGLRSVSKGEMWAIKDAQKAEGPFPIAIYAPSFSAMAWENADLCEYLASNGYVVIAAPSMGAHTRLMTLNLEGVDAQARDISWLIGFAESLKIADMSKIAVVGFSWGGLSSLVAAARDSRIRALVALDGSQRYYPGLAKLADVNPETLDIPMIYFAQGDYSLEVQGRFAAPGQWEGPSVLNAWRQGDLVFVHMLGMTHWEFSSMLQRNVDSWRDFSYWRNADYDQKSGELGYLWVARYTRMFLDAYLKKSSDAKGYLTKDPGANGAPEHFMDVRFSVGMHAPASYDGFRERVGRRGFDHVDAAYEALKKERPDFSLNEVKLNDWAEDLIGDGRFVEANSLLLFESTLFPNSADVYTLLGDAYRARGDKIQARSAYRRALEKDPLNSDAKGRLERLDGRL